MIANVLYKELLTERKLKGGDIYWMVMSPFSKTWNLYWIFEITNNKN